MSYKSKKTKPDTLNEPMAVYLPLNQVQSSFMEMLGGNDFTAASTSEWDILKLARQGLTKSVLLAMAKKISVTLQEFAQIMHITERTFQRYDDNDVIRAEYSEKAIALARLYDRGGEVFGSVDKFKIWMRTPLYVFHGETPLSLLDTSIGFEMVLDELGRIEHGIFA